MKIGTCISPTLFEEAFPAADYVEVPARTFFTMDEGQFRAFCDRVESGQLTPGACNCLTPNELRLTGPEVDMQAIENYCAVTFDRMAQLHIPLLVFGAGRSKSVPEGFSREKAWEQLLEIGTLFARTAKQYGQTIAVEPLSYTETNIINTVQEAADYIRAVNMPNFKFMVDFYHFDNNNDDPAALQKSSADLVHAHFAAPKTREIPQSEADFAFVRQCLGMLKNANYNGALSFEGKHPAPALTNQALHAVKQLWSDINA